MLNDKWKSAAAALTLFAVNAWVTIWLFHTEYIAQMGSIEGAFIGLARYIGGHPGQLHWFPLWYGGIPFPNSYPPLLHVTVAAVSSAAHISAASAYHAVVATVYALGPVALFWAARRLGAGRAVAFTGGLLYSLLSPSCWLVREIRVDSGGWFGPRRLMNLAVYGEGPHLASLLFLALAVGALHVALEKRRPWHFLAAAMALAGVVLSNWLGALALGMAAACYLLAGWDGARGLPWFPRWLRAAGIGCYAYALAMPWVPPSTIRIIRINAPKLVGWAPTSQEYKLWAALIAGVLLLAWILRRSGVQPRVRFGIVFLWSMAVVTLGAYWLHIKIIPQPERYHLEMDMAFWLTLTLVAEPLAAGLRGRRWQPVRRYAWMAIAAACVPVIVYQHGRAREMEKPIDIPKTAEYRISHWLGANLPGRRVFAPGSTGFWMNAFSDTPMIVGGFDNGLVNQLLWGVNYQIYAGDKLENTVAWLSALGCDAIVGGDPASGEAYHPYSHPEKLHDLRELWRGGAETIYAVPRARQSLAHVLRPADLLREAPETYNIKPMEPFLAALDDPSLPDAKFQWRNSSAASVSGDLEPGQLLYVQVAWDQGWNARVNGSRRKTWADPLGQMVVEPQCSGPCTVELVWDGGPEMRVARLLCPAALAVGLLWVLWGLPWRKRLDSPTKN
jgi:hypothetical protein